MRLRLPIGRICMSLALMVSLALQGPGLRAEEPRRDWSRVQALPADQKIVVKPFKGMSPKVKGAYVSSDAERLIVRKQNGQSVTIPKDHIRLVLGKERQRHTVWISAVAGFAIASIWSGVAGGADFTAAYLLVFGGAGAGIGALVGLAARAAGKTYVVYRAENPDPRASKTP